MEEEDAFIPNLASMLEVSLVEDTSSMVTLTAAEGSDCIVLHVDRKILNNIPV
jgi:hypothetical protein